MFLTLKNHTGTSTEDEFQYLIAKIKIIFEKSKNKRFFLTSSIFINKKRRSQKMKLKGMSPMQYRAQYLSK